MVTSRSWFHLWDPRDPDLRQGVKQMEKKTICHCYHIDIKISRHNCREKREACKMIVIKLRHSQNPTEQIAFSERPVSDLSERRDCYIYECLNSICHHLRAATKIW